MATLMNPGVFKRKPESPEETLVLLTEYLESFTEWMVITGLHEYTDYQKWALLSATGGPVMRDLLKHESGVEWRQRDRVQAVLYQAARVADPTHNVAARDEIEAQDEIPAIVPDTWEVGVAKLKKAVTKDTNPVISRYHLFQEMPQGDWDINKWAIELEKQAKRCDWSKYTWKEACTDAILFQMTSKTWRDKALHEQWTFQKIVEWGRKNVISSKHGKRPPGEDQTPQRRRGPPGGPTGRRPRKRQPRKPQGRRPRKRQPRNPQEGKQRPLQKLQEQPRQGLLPRCQPHLL